VQKYLKKSDGPPFATLRLCLYYVQRLLTSRRLRLLGTRVALLSLQLRYSSGQRMTARSDLSQVFARQGIASLGQVLTSRECAEVIAYLADKSVVDSRGSGRQFQLSERPVESSLLDHSLQTVVNCPHILKLANRPDLLQLASEILGFTPTITNLSLRWSFPSSHSNDDVQHFHRDVELSSFKVLVYLTDVGMDSGPHVYVTESHRDRMPVRLRRYSDSEVVRGGRTIKTVTGEAGTAFAVDTKGIHKGEPPTLRPRLLLGIQYSLLPCLLYDYFPASHCSASVFDHYVNRLIIDFNGPYPASVTRPRNARALH